MLTNPNHLIRELQAWLDLSLNTYENCEWVLTNPNHLVQGLQTWLDLSLNTYEIGFKFKHLWELKSKEYKLFI